MTLTPNESEFWETNYLNAQLPWDLDGPTPVYARLAASGEFEPGRMLVLGAGRGHDARLFARHGFLVTAVDFATGAVRAMEGLREPDAPIIIMQADLFHLPATLDNAFDYVLEYTCFCAIDPARREEYADVVARLLKPGGLYVALAFPIGKRAGGPPFVVQPDEMITLFEARGFTLLHREFPPDSVPARTNIEELLILQAPTGDEAL